MKHRTLFALALCLFSVSLFAEDRSITYAGLKWGSGMKDVMKALQRNGQTIGEVTDDQIMFTQTLNGGSLQGQAKFEDHGLAAVNLFYFPDAGKAVKFFDTIVRTYTNEFGAPNALRRQFDDPFEEGDGLEDTAIRNKKATLIAGWLPAEGESGGRLRVAVGPTNDQITIGVMFSRD